MRRGAAWITKYEFWLVWVVAAPLVLSSNLPRAVLYLALGSVVVFWLARKITTGSWSVPTPLDLPLALLLSLGLVGVAVANDTAVSSRLYLELVGGVAVYYGVVNGISTRRLGYGIWTIVGLGVGLGVVGLLGLHFSGKFLPVLIYPYLPKLDLAFLNPRGFAGNIVAGAIAPIVPLAIAWAVAQRGLARVMLLAAAVGLLGIILLTQSRGALFGVALGLSIVLVWRIPRLSWLFLLAAAFFVAAVVFYGPGTLGEALMVSDSTGSAGGRLELWERALQMMRDFPFTGIGIGAFEPVVQTLYPLFLSSPGQPQPHAHNYYLQMGIDFGIGGLAAFLGIVITALGMGLRNVRAAADETVRAIAVGLLAAYVTYLMHSLLDAVALSTKVSVVVWLVLALMMALAARRVQNV